MPIYEYRCGNCKRRVSIFFRSFSAVGEARCPNCDSVNLSRLVSRVATLKSEETRLESLADPSSLGDVDENDPRSVARMMRKMSGEMGEDMGPEFNEMVDRLESGESPESIEQSMPGLAGPGEGAGDLGGEM
ncbi:MAG: FmdB family zinc ribbon protein [Anaerolineae bacterium]